MKNSVNMNNSTINNNQKVLNRFLEDLKKWTNPTKVFSVGEDVFIEIGTSFTKVKNGYVFDTSCSHISEVTFTSDGTINRVKYSNAFNGSYKQLRSEFDRGVWN